MSDIIKSVYQQKCDKASDINEHLPILRELAAEGTSVAELGVGFMVSTWAFLDGLASNVGEPDRKLYCVDIENVPGVENAIEVAAQAGIAMEFTRTDSATIELPTVDLLFIDSWHAYGHLKRELAFHHHRAKKYIVMHDTESFKFSSDSFLCGWNMEEQSKVSGYSIDEIKKGLQPAVDEFLAAHASTWRIHRHYPNNNGLTVLIRS